MPVAMSLIFIGSSPLTEDISSSKCACCQTYGSLETQLKPVQIRCIRYYR
jgi:hypothetical protein